MAENVPNLKKETYIQIQEAPRVPNKMNPKIPMPRYNKKKWQKLKRGF